MALKAVLTPGNRYGWRGALVLPEEYFEASVTGITGTIAATESGSDTASIDGVIEFPSTASDGSYVNISGTSFVAITDVLQVRTNASGDLFFSGDITYEPQTLTNGGYNVYTIWRYRTVGGSWTDVGTEVAAVQAASVITGVLEQVGVIDATASITTLSANTNYEVQLYARRALASPTNDIAFFTSTLDATVSAVAGAITGTLSATETGADTCVSDGDVIVQGSLAATESGSDTAALTGDVIVQGTVAATETGSDTAASTGDVIVQGSLSATESGSDTSATSGKVIVQGSLAATESGSDTVTSTGTITVQGAIAVTESGSDTIASTGTVLIQGLLAATETGSDTAAISGVIGTPAITGTISATEVGNDTVVADGDVIVQGSVAAADVGSDTATAVGQIIIQGALAATEVGSDTAAASGTVTYSEIFGIVSAQESSSDSCFSYGFTLAPKPIIEYDVRLFDSMRSSGNLRGAYKSMRGLEHMMWDRVLQKCEYQTKAYVTAADPNTWRIGYGRPITRSAAVEEAELRKVRENVWLRSKLTDFYQRVASATPTAELHEALTSTLYYYHVENQKR